MHLPTQHLAKNLPYLVWRQPVHTQKYSWYKRLCTPHAPFFSTIFLRIVEKSLSAPPFPPVGGWPPLWPVGGLPPIGGGRVGGTEGGASGRLTLSPPCLPLSPLFFPCHPVPHRKWGLTGEGESSCLPVSCKTPSPCHPCQLGVLYPSLTSSLPSPLFIPILKSVRGHG